MMPFVFTPSWFFTPDVIINLFSFLVLLAFFILCIRSYKISKNKDILSLGIGFVFVAIAQLALVITTIHIYYHTILTTYIGHLIISYNIIKSSSTLYDISFFLSRFFTLLGLAIIYRLPIKKKSVTDFILMIYLIILSVLISEEINFFFYITALVMLLIIVYNYYSVYKKNKFENTKILIIAFGLLAISQFLFTLSQISSVTDVLASVIGLISYITLLVLIIRISRYGNKKKQNGYNFGYVKHNPRKRR